MNTWKKIFRVSFGFMFFALLLSRAYGQGQGRVDRYNMTFFSATWTDIQTTGTPVNVFASDPNDGFEYSSVPLPFDFPYDSVIVPAGPIHVGVDGYISLITAYIPNDPNAPIDDEPVAEGNWTPQSGISDPTYPGLIDFFGGYLWNGNNLTPPEFYYQVDGTSPTRVLTIEFPGVSVWGNQGNGTHTDMQVKFYETTGTIEFLYRDHNYNLVGSLQNVSIGIGLNGFHQNALTPSFVYNAYATQGVVATPASDIRWSLTPPAPPSELSLEAKNLNFGTLLPGQTDTLCVTAMNVGVPDTLGPATLHIQGFNLSGDPDFSVISGPSAGDSILAGQSMQYCIRFSPTAPFTRSATFTLRTDGRDSGMQIVSLNGISIAPAIAVGATSLFHRMLVKLDNSATLYIPISSTGTGPLNIQSISVTGLNADNYYISHYPQNPLPAGMSDSIGITFTPTMEGRPDASVIIHTDAVNLPLDSIPLFGVGILPRLVITPSYGTRNTLTFGSVAFGDSLCESLSLANPGSDTLLFTHQFLEGDPDFTFHPLVGTDTLILPGQSRLVDVCFHPLQRGTRIADIRFYTNIPLTYEHPRRDTSQFSLNITGTGVASGRLIVTGPLADSAEIGKTLCVTDTIENIGTADVTITSATVAGTNGSEFILSGVEPLPFTLAIGEKKIVTLCFTPEGRGLRTAGITVAGSNASQAFTELFPLLGYGLEICASANPTPATFGASGKTLVGATDTTVITITNCGDVSTAYTATASPSNYTIVGSSTSGNIVPNGTASYTVVFAPTAVGAVPGTLSFTGGLPASVPLNGVGAGVMATATGSAGSVGKGACQDFTVTIVNTGNMDWVLNAATIAGTNAADFTIVNGPTPDTLPPGDTAMMTLKFCPSIVGSETAALTFPSGSPSPIGGFSYALTGTGVVNGVSEQSSDRGFELGQSYPNPTTGSAVVMFTLPMDAPVHIDLIDAKGSIIRTVFTGRMTSGDHSVTLDAKDVASGTYFYTLTSGDIHLTRQMILVR